MYPVLKEYVNKVYIVNLDKEQLNTIKKIISPQRTEKQLLSKLSPIGLLMPDHCFFEKGQGPTITVEIKPQLGFIHPGYAKEGFSDVHDTPFCKVCLKEDYKSSKTNRRRSGYFPLDLFSGFDDRMVRAIESLKDFPKNQFKIFKDGVILNDENTANNVECEDFLSTTFGDTSILPHLLVAILKSEPNDTEIVVARDISTKVDNNLNEIALCNRTSKLLPEKCILNRILSIQQKNQITNEEALKIFTELLDYGLDEYLIQELVNCGDKYEKEIESKELLMKLEKLRTYQLCMTMRSLSIIVTIMPQIMENDNNDDIENSRIIVNNKYFKYKLAAVDLDPKKFTKIEKRIGLINKFSKCS